MTPVLGSAQLPSHLFLVFAASVDAARSWRGGGTLQPLTPAPCAAAAMTAAKGDSHHTHPQQHALLHVTHLSQTRMRSRTR